MLAQEVRPSPDFLTVAEEADIGARILPGGFGGLYQNLGVAANSLVGYFTDLSESAAARQDLQRALVCGAIYPGWSGLLLRTADLFAILAHQGEWTGSELLTFLHALEPLTNDPAVWAVEIDPERNRMWVGLLDGSQVARIQAEVAARGVPAAAVLLELPPPVAGTEQFEVLNSPVDAIDFGIEGVLYLPLEVRFTNRQADTRYPDWCVNPDPEVFLAYFGHAIEKWNGAEWREIYRPACRLILLHPRPVAPGENLTDNVPVGGSRRLNLMPYWSTARTTGTYRFVGQVYQFTTPNPGGGPDFVTDLAPFEEQVSAPFRVINRLPF